MYHMAFYKSYISMFFHMYMAIWIFDVVVGLYIYIYIYIYNEFILYFLMLAIVCKFYRQCC
jgi:hypothetical protein